MAVHVYLHALGQLISIDLPAKSNPRHWISQISSAVRDLCTRQPFLNKSSTRFSHVIFTRSCERVRDLNLRRAEGRNLILFFRYTLKFYASTMSVG